MCGNLDLIPLNHLKKENLNCKGGWTYRQGQLWKSQIDWALCSLRCINCIEGFEIIYDNTFPSNHAPISVRISNDTFLFIDLVNRSQMLQSSLEEKDETSICCKKPVKLDRIG